MWALFFLVVLVPCASSWSVMSVGRSLARHFAIPDEMEVADDVIANDDDDSETEDETEIKAKTKGSITSAKIADLNETLPNLKLMEVSYTTHDPTCFTQGITFITDTKLLVSCGLYGRSRLYEAEIDAPTVPIVETKLPYALFAEGLTLIRNGTQVVVLTWREGKVMIYDTETLTPVGMADVPHEGWGIISLGSNDENSEHLVVSDGSPYLYHYNLTWGEGQKYHMALTKKVLVHINDTPVARLNELERLDEKTLLANVWYDKRVIRVHVDTGDILGYADLSYLHPGGSDPDVLNGIAMRPSDYQMFQDNGQAVVWATGKRWGYLYKLRLAGFT